MATQNLSLAHLKKSRSKNDSVAEQPIHHDYLKSQKKPPKFSSLYEEIRQFINEYGIEEETLSEKEALKLWVAFASRNVKYICETMLSIDAIKKCVIGLLMNQTDATASQMMTRKYSTSVLMQKSLSDLKAFDWFSVFEEMKSKFPELLALMLSLIIKREGRNLYTIMEKVVSRLGTVYGILMQGRNKELSLIQRLNSSVLLDNICDVKVSTCPVYMCVLLMIKIITLTYLSNICKIHILILYCLIVSKIVLKTSVIFSCNSSNIEGGLSLETP